MTSTSDRARREATARGLKGEDWIEFVAEQTGEDMSAELAGNALFRDLFERSTAGEHPLADQLRNYQPTPFDR